MNKYSPVIVFVYSRPEHTKKMLSALKRNRLSAVTDLIIYSDAAKTEKETPGVLAVREYIKKLHGFKSITIIEQEKNLGLANSIIQGVTATVKKYGRAIVLEDDIETSPYFLQFMNEALDLYSNIKTVGSISGSSYPVEMQRNIQSTYLLRIPLCWGWATWEDRWSMFEKDLNKVSALDEKLKQYVNFDGAFDFFEQATLNAEGKLNTWFVFWYITLASNKKLTLFPSTIMARNIGHDGSGENCDGNDIYKNISVSNEPVKLELKEKIVEDKNYYLSHIKYFKKNKRGILTKVLSYAKRKLLGA